MDRGLKNKIIFEGATMANVALPLVKIIDIFITHLTS